MNKVELVKVSALRFDDEISELVPEMTSTEFKGLLSSIKEDGVRQPIHINSDLTILDGRHRVRACVELGIKDIQAVVHEMSRDAAIAFVRDTAIERRNLTNAQKIDIALRSSELIDEIEKKAKEREVGGKKVTLDPNGTRVKGGRTNEKLGEIVGTSKNSIARMKKVKKESPSLYKEVVKGEKTISGAYFELPTVAKPKPKVAKEKVKPVVPHDPYKDIPKEQTEFTMAHSNLVFNLDNVSYFIKENKKRLPDAIRKVSQDDPALLKKATEQIEYLVKLIKQNEENINE